MGNGYPLQRSLFELPVVFVFVATFERDHHWPGQKLPTAFYWQVQRKWFHLFPVLYNGWVIPGRVRSYLLIGRQVVLQGLGCTDWWHVWSPYNSQTSVYPTRNCSNHTCWNVAHFTCVRNMHYTNNQMLLKALIFNTLPKHACYMITKIYIPVKGYISVKLVPQSCTRVCSKYHKV